MFEKLFNRKTKPKNGTFSSSLQKKSEQIESRIKKLQQQRLKKPLKNIFNLPKIYKAEFLQTDKKTENKTRYVKPKDKKIETKVFAPVQKTENQEEIKDYQKKPDKVFLKNNKTDKPIKPINIIKSINLNQSLNYLLMRFNILENINKLIFRLTVLSLITVFIYLSFFDHYFLVKTYKINFSENSYLSETEIQTLTQSFSQNPFLGVIPNNQFWFVNDRNLTTIAKQEIPEVTDVKVIRRRWPNIVELKVIVEPVLITLQVTENNQLKYYRVSQSGRIVTEDIARLRENLVIVERSPILTSGSVNVSFKDYPIENNFQQVNRFWFTLWIKEILSFDIQSIVLPSLEDTEVVVITNSGTRLYFDSNVNSIPKETLANRVTVFESSSFFAQVNQGLIDYVDFRIPSKKIFLCYKGQTCQNDL